MSSYEYASNQGFLNCSELWAIAQNLRTHCGFEMKISVTHCEFHIKNRNMSTVLFICCWFCHELDWTMCNKFININNIASFQVIFESPKFWRFWPGCFRTPELLLLYLNCWSWNNKILYIPFKFTTCTFINECELYINIYMYQN